MIDTQALQVLQLLWRLTLLLSLATLLLALVRPLLLARLGASATYMAWLLVPMLMLSPLLPELPQQGLALPIQPDVAPTTAAITSAPEPVLTRAAAPAIAPALLLLWLTGMLALALLMAQRQRRFTAQLRLEGGNWRAPAGSSPAMLGLRRPRLVLPQDFERRFSAEEQRLILAHEGVHASRRDNAWNLLAAALLVLQWFNPLAWWALWRMRADQELACDAAVSNRHGDLFAKHYLTALLKSCHDQPMPVLVNGWGAQHPVLERARMLGQHRRSARQRRLGALAAMALCAGATVLARAAQPAAPLEAEITQATGPGELGVTVHLDVMQGGEAWQHRQLLMPLPPHYPVTGHQGIRLNAKQGDWCLGVLLYGFPDGSIRPMAELMDARCQTSLTPLSEVPVGADHLDLAAKLQGQDLLTKIRVQWGSAADPRIAAVTQRQQPSAEQLAEQRAHIASQLNSRRALDEAWQRARSDAAQAMSAQPAPPAPSPAAIPASPLPPAAPRGPAGIAPPPAPPAVPAERTGAGSPAATAVTASAAAPIRVALALEFEERQGERKQSIKAQPTLVLNPGSTGTLRVDVGDKPGPGSEADQEQLEVSLSLRELGDEKIAIEAQLRLLKSGEIIAKPRLITRNGVKARIETGRDKGPEGSRFIRLDVLPTVLAGQAPPQ